MADIGEFMQSRTLKAADFDEPTTVTIKYLEPCDKYDGKPLIHFSEYEKPMVANATNLKRIAVMHGRDYEGWRGKKVTLFSDMVQSPTGEIVPAIRVMVKAAKKPSLDDEVPF